MNTIHNNVRLFQRLATRVLPRCSYSNVFHVMDEPLAHLYDLARDALFFLDVLDNRKKYINSLISAYGDLLRKINNMYPMCHQYSVANVPSIATVGGDAILVDNMGNKVNQTDNFNTVVDVYDAKRR